MTQKKFKIVLAITGASGSVYAKVMLDKLTTVLSDQIEELSVLMSTNAQEVWRCELGNESFGGYSVKYYSKYDFSAPFASGSAKYDAMVVMPCSMGTMGRIANGISDDLLTRAADVQLKERRKLILVIRDTPYNLIHINNMKTISEAGGIICPASPSFYSQPKDFEQLAATVVDRVIDLIGLDNKTYRWGEKE